MCPLVSNKEPVHKNEDSRCKRKLLTAGTEFSLQVHAEGEHCLRHSLFKHCLVFDRINSVSEQGRQVFFLLLCVSILFQMLGVPATLAEPVGTDDLVKGSILTGYAVPSTSSFPPILREGSEQPYLVFPLSSHLSAPHRFSRPPPAYSGSL